MTAGLIGKNNVGRIAERIVANELEYRGFRVSDLNRDGTSANADLIAAGHERTWQLQIKGASNSDGSWWFQYGYCTDAIIHGKEPMFNRHSSFYKADIVVLVCVKSPKEYSCIVLPVGVAEEAAQINLNRDYRTPRRDGKPKKPNKVWVPDWNPRKQDALLEAEKALLTPFKNNWGLLSA